jgi:hypothetical protein
VAQTAEDVIVNDFNADLSRVLRYSSDTVTNLLQQLQQPEQQQHRWGTDGGQQGLRHVLADALDESGRGTEAELLRTPQQHIVVRDGKVRAGKFTGSHIGKAAYDLDDLIDRYEQGTPDIGWAPTLGMAKTGTYGINKTGFVDDTDFHHLSEAGGVLADAFKNDLIRQHHPALNDYHYERLEDAIRNAPYEEVDTAHPTERSTT